MNLILSELRLSRGRLQRFPWHAVVLLVCFLNHPAGARAQNAIPLPNRWCPVTPGQAALPEHKLRHKGDEIWFCCEQCTVIFGENPDVFLSNLHEARAGEFSEQNTEMIPRPAHHESPFDLVANSVLPYKNSLYLVLASLLLFMIAKRLKARRKESDPMGLRPKSPVISALAKPQTLLVLMQLSLLMHFIFWDNEDSAGKSPVIIRKSDDSAEIILRLLSRQPEISEQLLQEERNGMQLRVNPAYEIRSVSDQGDSAVVLARLNLRTQTGEVVGLQSPVGDGQLYLHWDIDMSAAGAGSVFNPNDLGQMTLLSLANAESLENPIVIGSEIRLAKSAEGNQWQFRYPLGEIVAGKGGETRLAGTLYLCQPLPRQIGLQTLDSAKFAVHYSILIKEGKVDSASKMWMTCLARGPKPLRIFRQDAKK